MTGTLNTPILFLVFNRPETTLEVFNAIKKQRPTRLYIAADGPREGKPGEKEKCNKVRSITNKIDWLCEVKTLYREENLGCRQAVSEAISWFFENEEEGIILEDDCLPDASFFTYCEVLLNKYRNDNRVLTISGYNGFEEYLTNTNYESFFFSKYPHVWGWATWKRTWQLYDKDMSKWNLVKNDPSFMGQFSHYSSRLFWKNIFEQVRNYKLDSWATPFTFTSFINNGLSVIPSVNLVKNIGFGEGATHTTKALGYMAKDAHQVSFPLISPPYIQQNHCYDSVRSRFEYRLGKKGFLKYLYSELSARFKTGPQIS